ncbi:MAG: hypothetical protein COV57_02010 [Candidatus Liptonbacteria bacterium CG11_big_fil_rev_8_21_14_0_20_35_14]|uniref:GtrA/DPMS transmembrane domain-containing protein n=1 Tax=Candidatus Liptonbacteria bacterium CG11_big_fil_rev_8_21_14_0_20_35_14 TaxID=1974634 RepID=A0A2H0N7M2_9BACT|nr:MAG: hypothetical protein COV57_02010 [Candidatus Liptonbacteria bacterium CG11_big_fil_rev_8_21_14_0_20_35_14]
MIQFFKFAIVGGINTLVDFTVLYLLIFSTGITGGMGYSLFKGISFLVAVGNSYLLNKSWTFRDRSKKNSKEAIDFLFVSVIGLLINVGIASLVVNGINPLEIVIIPLASTLGFIEVFMSVEQIWAGVGGLTATAVSLIWNFFGYKIFVFKKGVDPVK